MNNDWLLRFIAQGTAAFPKRYCSRAIDQKKAMLKKLACQIVKQQSVTTPRNLNRLNQKSRIVWETRQTNFRFLLFNSLPANVLSINCFHFTTNHRTRVNQTRMIPPRLAALRLANSFFFPFSRRALRRSVFFAFAKRGKKNTEVKLHFPPSAE